MRKELRVPGEDLARALLHLSLVGLRGDGSCEVSGEGHCGGGGGLVAVSALAVSAIAVSALRGER